MISGFVRTHKRLAHIAFAVLLLFLILCLFKQTTVFEVTIEQGETQFKHIDSFSIFVWKDAVNEVESRSDRYGTDNALQVEVRHFVLGKWTIVVSEGGKTLD